jgi:hypothetical protein
MNPDLIVLLMLAVTVLSLGLSGYFFYASFDHARPVLPAGLQEDFTACFAIDRFIWWPAVPAAAQRSYLLSRAYASVGLFCMTVLAAGNSSAIVVGILAAATLAASVITLRCWFRFRKLD